jgi:uncharacterized membrane protein
VTTERAAPPDRDPVAAGPTSSDPPTTSPAKRVRRYLRGLNHVGVILGGLFFALSLTPSLLPRPWALQALLSGVTSAGGYGLGVVISWSAWRIGVQRPNALVRRRAWHGIGALAVITIPIILWLSSGWQQEIRRAVDQPLDGRTPYLGVFALAVAVAVALIGVVRLFHDIYLRIAARLLAFFPRAVARSLAAVLAVALAVAVGNGVVYRGSLQLADAVFSSLDHGSEAGVVRPVSVNRSGGASSMVTWNSLGEYGRSFVATGPTMARIQQLTGRSAVEPIRVFAGTASAPTLHSRAELVLAELRRTRAFDRRLLAVATTTGRGWVDPTLADPLEYMYGGDTAIASMQYSYLPSWMSFLTDQDRARLAGRELFDTVYGYWSTLPAAYRPRLVVFGESLGAFGSGAAFSSVADLTGRTAGALFAGPPNITQPWRNLTDRRVAGSLERLPRYGDGNMIRFAASAADLREPSGSLSHPAAVYLQHASDPIVWWSPHLIWRKPAWLAESRGSDVVRQVQWYPLITFWQISCDLTVSVDPPAGHGHHYGPEVATAWSAVLDPPNWTAADTVALTDLQAAEDGLAG